MAAWAPPLRLVGRLPPLAVASACAFQDRLILFGEQLKAGVVEHREDVVDARVLFGFAFASLAIQSLLLLLLTALLVIAINLPAGYWRAGQRKFGWQWFLAVHAPIPIVVALRLLLQIGFGWHTYVVLVAAYFAGQALGARLRRRHLQP